MHRSVCVAESFIHSTHISRAPALCESLCWCWEHRREWDPMELRALIEAPSTPAIRGKGGSNSAEELEGSFGLLGARLKIRPSARIQQPPTRPALQSCTRASQLQANFQPPPHTLPHTGSQDTKQQLLPPRIKNSHDQDSQSPQKSVKTTPGPRQGLALPMEKGECAWRI